MEGQLKLTWKIIRPVSPFFDLGVLLDPKIDITSSKQLRLQNVYQSHHYQPTPKTTLLTKYTIPQKARKFTDDICALIK